MEEEGQPKKKNELEFQAWVKKILMPYTKISSEEKEESPFVQSDNEFGFTGYVWQVGGDRYSFEK